MSHGFRLQKLMKSKFTVLKILILERIKFLDMDQTMKSGSEKLFLVQFFGIPFCISYRYNSQINNKIQIVCGMVLNDQKFWIPNQWECPYFLDWTKNNFSLLNFTFWSMSKKFTHSQNEIGFPNHQLGILTFRLYA